jgi:hypothetical protein
MYATVEDLKKGDVVLIGSSSGIYDVKLLRTPQKAKQGKLTTWLGKTRWTAVPCEVRIIKVNNSYTLGGKTQTYVTTEKVISNGEPYTDEKRIDFTGRQCWIIKREI